MAVMALGTRAVERIIGPGSSAYCAHCGKQVKFAAAKGLRQVIANVYDAGNWDRVEHYHRLCYDEAGQPYGSVQPFVQGNRR